MRAWLGSSAGESFAGDRPGFPIGSTAPSTPAPWQCTQGCPRRARAWMVRFWDTSAPRASPRRRARDGRAERWLREDAAVVVLDSDACGAALDLSAAAGDKNPCGQAIAGRATRAPRRVGSLVLKAARSSGATPERLVASHPLRAADALQLGAALAAAEDDSGQPRLRDARIGSRCWPRSSGVAAFSAPADSTGASLAEAHVQRQRSREAHRPAKFRRSSDGRSQHGIRSAPSRPTTTGTSAPSCFTTTLTIWWRVCP